MGKHVLAVIGGGSVFTPELVHWIASDPAAFGGSALRLMDIDPHRLEIVGGLARRIAARLNSPISITLTDKYEDALDGADFVLIQLRQGGQDARIQDEMLGRKHHIPFAETISVCGFATFLRTYPVVERLARLIQERAPSAWVFNFTNPAGQLAETFSTLGCSRVVGVCNTAVGIIDQLADHLHTAPDDLFMNWRGLNHLTFADKIYHHDTNILPRLLEEIGTYLPKLPFPSELVKSLGLIPNPYLQYYYLKDRIVEKQSKAPKLRSEIVKEIEVELLGSFAAIDDVPDLLKQRGGYGYARVAVNLIRGIITNSRWIHYANVPNGSTLPELPVDAFVEVPVVATVSGIHPLQVEPLPPVARGLVSTMKQYERILIQAARERNREGLLHALLVHPLIPSFDVARSLLQDVLDVNRAFLPEFH